MDRIQSLEQQLREEVIRRQRAEDEVARMGRAIAEDQVEMDYLTKLSVEQKRVISALQAGHVAAGIAQPPTSDAAGFGDDNRCAKQQELEEQLRRETQLRQFAEKRVSQWDAQLMRAVNELDALRVEHNATVQRLQAAEAEVQSAKEGNHPRGTSGESCADVESSSKLARCVKLVKEKNLEIMHLNRALQETRRQVEILTAQNITDSSINALLQSKNAEISTLVQLNEEYRARLGLANSESESVVESPSVSNPMSSPDNERAAHNTKDAGVPPVSGPTVEILESSSVAVNPPSSYKGLSWTGGRLQSSTSVSPTRNRNSGRFTTALNEQQQRSPCSTSAAGARLSEPRPYSKPPSISSPSAAANTPTRAPRPSSVAKMPVRSRSAELKANNETKKSNRTSDGKENRVGNNTSNGKPRVSAVGATGSVMDYKAIVATQSGRPHQVFSV